jgi:hypothetical protein
VREIERGDRIRLADKSRDCLAFEARLSARKNRLIGERRDYAKAITTRNIGGGEDAYDRGVCGEEAFDISERKLCVMMRRTDDTAEQAVGGNRISAEQIAARDFRFTIEAPHTLADRRSRL